LLLSSETILTNNGVLPHMATATEAPAALRSFEESAPFYDRLTDESDYEHAMGLLELLAQEVGLAGKRLLDLGCGTGKSFMPLLGRGYEVTACDLSPAMVDQAIRRANGRARVFVADIGSLGKVGSFDLITCIDEPLNYLLEEDDVLGLFCGVVKNLAPGGLFVFDVNTVLTYGSVFAGQHCYEAGDWLFVWRGEVEGGFGAGRTAAVTIEAFGQEADGRWSRTSSRHVQRHHQRRTLLGLMRRAGLECLAVHGLTREGRLGQPGREDRHSKLVYLARLASERTEAERG
jgi:SAM-dependent methyltransferase